MSVPEHSDLPLRDYDHLPAAAVSQRIRSLTADQLGTVLDYEQAHANRPAIVQAMRSRLAELADGAAPSGGTGQGGPDRPEPASAGSPVGPETAGPPSNPPPHGEPAQPARPKADRQAP